VIEAYLGTGLKNKTPKEQKAQKEGAA